MKTELYNTIFLKMDELLAVRENETLRIIIEKQHRYFPIILSDCIYEIFLNCTIDRTIDKIIDNWNMRKPFLIEQSDELGEKLLLLIK